MYSGYGGCVEGDSLEPVGEGGLGANDAALGLGKGRSESEGAQGGGGG